jgi:predicted XRE-type DNA-binding protein
MPGINKLSKPGHITTGDILDDLGFSPQETLEAKLKLDLWRDLLAHIERRGFDQAHLIKTLQVYQPDVSNLLRGKISKFSTGKLIQFAVRLNLDVRVQLKEVKTQKRSAPTSSNGKTGKRNRQQLVHA